MSKSRKHRKIAHRDQKPKKEKSSKKLLLAQIVLLFVFLGMIVTLTPQIIGIFDPLVPGEQKLGTVAGLHQPPVYRGTETHFLIKLDNGAIIEIDGTGMGIFQKGRRVIVQEFTSKILHHTRLALDEVLGYRDEVIEGVLVLLLHRSLVPLGAKFAAAAKVGLCINTSLVNPHTAQRTETGFDTDPVPAIAVK